MFSDNHEVTGPDGRKVDLGSFRASGGFIADLLNAEQGIEASSEGPFGDLQFRGAMIANEGEEFSVEKFIEKIAAYEESRVGYHYMDFYMGTQMLASRADLSPVYRLIFRRLKMHDADWTYSFPRLRLVDLRPLKEQLDANDPDREPEWESYDPSASMAKEQEQSEKDAELAEMRARMADDHREAVKRARDGSPPTTVDAYRDVFGQLPEGWPPTVEE